MVLGDLGINGQHERPLSDGQQLNNDLGHS